MWDCGTTSQRHHLPLLLNHLMHLTLTLTLKLNFGLMVHKPQQTIISQIRMILANVPDHPVITHGQSRLANAAKPKPKPTAQTFFAPQNLSDTSKGAQHNTSPTTGPPDTCISCNKPLQPRMAIYCRFCKVWTHETSVSQTSCGICCFCLSFNLRITESVHDVSEFPPSQTCEHIQSAWSLFGLPTSVGCAYLLSSCCSLCMASVIRLVRVQPKCIRVAGGQGMVLQTRFRRIV